MYKIVLIDDENIVRRGIRDLIDWKSLRLEMAGDAEDGEKGLELIRNVLPDIVFLDINMPKIDGIKVGKVIRETYPDIKIVLITGYDDFAYVREALRLGVEDYILKPITKNEIEVLLRKLVEKLDKEKEERINEEKIKHKIAKSETLMEQNSIEELIFDELEEQLVIKRCHVANIPYDKKNYGITLIDYDMSLKGGAKNDKEITFFAIKNILREILQTEGTGIVFEAEGINGVFYFSDETENAEMLYHQQLIPIKQKINEVLGITVTMGVGGLVKNIGKIGRSYKMAHEALVNRFFLGKDRMITKESYNNLLATSNKNEWIIWETKLLESIKEKEGFKAVLEDIEKKMEQIGMTMEGCQDIWNILVGAILKKFVQIDETVISLFPDTLDTMREIKDQKTIEDIRKWFYGIYYQCYDYIENQAAPNRVHMQSIMAFIETHYAIPELSVAMICNKVHLSPSYFSAIFKKETGYTFIQYITQYRLEKAKELLQYTQFRTYEVAENVGYSDPQYFSTLFKKQFNMTPSQYKKLKTEDSYEKNA